MWSRVSDTSAVHEAHRFDLVICNVMLNIRLPTRIRKDNKMPASRTRPTSSNAGDLMEILRLIQNDERRSRNQPKSGDLVLDVKYLQQMSKKERRPEIKGIFARASIVMSVATIEAITNDALATIYDLLTDTIPMECYGDPPWRYFTGRSHNRVAGLLKKGSFAKKREYVLHQIERVTGNTISPDVLSGIDRLRIYRNRIMHMSYQESTKKYKSVLNSNDVVHNAKDAHDVMDGYIQFIGDEFSEMKLAIPTVRTPVFFEAELSGMPTEK